MRLLDTSAWVEYFRGTEKGAVVRTILAGGIAYTSAITLAEITKWLSENNLDSTIPLRQIKINSVIIPLEESILIESGRRYVLLRRVRPKIGLIDVIIYVSAHLHALMLVTGDSDFKGLPNVEMLQKVL